jgi:hypothetical protein
MNNKLIIALFFILISSCNEPKKVFVYVKSNYYIQIGQFELKALAYNQDKIRGFQQFTIFFYNGYGASIIKHDDLYNLWILKGNDCSFSPTYIEGISGGFTDNLNEKQIEGLLINIEKL